MAQPRIVTVQKIEIVSGIHGDEADVIPGIESALELLNETLPSYFWIPRASPTAIATNTRTNSEKFDLNRQFLPHSTCTEANALMQTLSNHYFDLFVSVHQDNDRREFYLYDTAHSPPHGWDAFKHALSLLQISLYTGIDDPQDPVLGCLIQDGYCSVPETTVPDGSLETWVIQKKIAKRALTLEIPGKSSTETKTKILIAFFSSILGSTNT